MWKYICEIFGQKIFTQTHTSWKGKCARTPAKSDKIIFFSQLSSPQGVKFVFFFLILITKLIAKIIFASWRAWSCICMIESMFAVHRNRITLKNFYLNLSFIKLLRIRAKRCQTFLSLKYKIHKQNFGRSQFVSCANALCNSQFISRGKETIRQYIAESRRELSHRIDPRINKKLVKCFMSSWKRSK